jgi:hypothetical protein
MRLFTIALVALLATGPVSAKDDDALNPNTKPLRVDKPQARDTADVSAQGGDPECPGRLRSRRGRVGVWLGEV